MSVRARQLAFVFLIAALLVAVPHLASATTLAGDFLSVGGGARALGMGGAFAASAADASTVYWNPAGISGFSKREALFMHSERFGDLVNYNFATLVWPTKLLSEEREAAFGFALIHQGVPDHIVTSHLDYEERNGIPGFQPGDKLLFDDVDALPREGYNDFSLYTSFAAKTKYGRLGGTLKLIYTDAIAGHTSTGIGLDIGYLYRDLFPRFDIGVNLRDITGTYIGWSTGTNEFITPSIKMGVLYRLPAPTLNLVANIAADGDVFFDDRRGASQFWVETFSADLRLGLELVFQEKVMVRGGLDAGNWTAGAGFLVNFLGFDYAYLHHRDDLEATHRISGLVRF
ncbi:MAG: PorV/PorQ family protein [Candidatus Latescibacterota bacterium]|nr:MAG: PorV/PorQ family protein [Candidatus Latescibacterota bacterium]